MIITEKVKIKVNNKHISKYRELGYVCKTNDIIEIKVEDLSYGSKSIIEAVCDICGNEKKIMYRDYLTNKKNHNLFSCSSKCSVIKREKTTIERYGVNHHMQIDHIKEKIKNTNLERYGVKNHMEVENIKEKIKNTNLERYGVECNLQLDYIKEKIKNTNLERYGTEYPSQSEYIKKKTRLNNKDKWGSISYTSSERYHLKTKIGNDINYDSYIGDRISLFNCDLGKNHKFEISSYNYLHRVKSNTPLCTVCNPIGDSQSIKEKELFEFINSIYNSEIIQSYRDGLEIDIYLPELKLGFEFNGLFWHSEKYRENNYHINKTNYFKESGIRIIHIWEDDWDYKRNILESQIKNWLGLTENKIFARKCHVREIEDSKIVTKFLEENHIQGKVNSNLKLGLYYGDDLVSLMTFDHFEGRKRMNKYNWNINRFCNKIDHNIIGGASKLFKYFLKNYDVKRVISYSDNDWSEGILYEKLGFNKVSESKPDYKYISEGIRVHKSRFRKSVTGFSESKLKLLKIWDCGKSKWEIFI